MKLLLGIALVLVVGVVLRRTLGGKYYHRRALEAQLKDSRLRIGYWIGFEPGDKSRTLTMRAQAGLVARLERYGMPCETLPVILAHDLYRNGRFDGRLITTREGKPIDVVVVGRWGGDNEQAKLTARFFRSNGEEVFVQEDGPTTKLPHDTIEAVAALVDDAWQYVLPALATVRANTGASAAA